MSWVTVIWSMTAAACLTLALVHVMVWISNHSAWSNLMFSLCAVTTAGFAAAELWMMQATTVETFTVALRWYQVPILLIVVSNVVFVRSYLGVGRPWLAWLACGTRAVSFAGNFWVWPNLYFQVTGVRQVSVFGESVAVVEGVPHPWMLVGQASLLLMIIFILDAMLTLWRRGERGRKLMMAGTMVAFCLGGSVMGTLTFHGIVQWPIATCLYYLPVVAVMSYELSRDSFHAARLAGELRRSEAHLNLAAESARFGIWMWEPGQDQIWGSAQWRDMLGFRPDESVTFDGLVQRLNPLDRDAVSRAMHLALMQQSGINLEFRVVLPDGSQRWISSHGRTVHDASGKPVQIFGAVSDITARKHAEREIDQQRQQLAHLSRVSRLGEMSGSLAHELNQPLTAILSNAQAAQRFLAQPKPDFSEVSEILEDIVSQDKRAGDIIARLRLLFSGGDMAYVPLAVNTVVDDVLKLLNSVIVQNGVHVDCDLADDLPDVAGDRVGLQQVLINLIMNASDAMGGMPRSERRLTIGTRRLDDASICVEVSDHGPGIAADRLEHVFDPFYTDKPHGMGLGLSICRTIVRAHGGRLWAENRAPRGASFQFALPLTAR